MPETERRGAMLSIWWFAFGYFACYAPYSALTKALSKGLLPGMDRAIPGFELLPSTALASMVGMFAFLTGMRWWKHAGRRTIAGLSIPMPSKWTFLSGLCTAAVIGTTTMAYTFSGVSIVFMMLLMRGGLLVIAPLVDLASKRKVQWYSWTALGLSFAALLVAFSSDGSFALSLIAVIDVLVYLASYVVRLRFMSRLAKSDDPNASVRYFVEEQMVASPAFVLAMAIASFGRAPICIELRHGFTSFWSSGVVGTALLVGLLSQGTGIFGGLILLDKRENTFCVPVNRASSVLAGVLASYALMLVLHQSKPDTREMFGAALIIAAIFVLAIPSLTKRKTPAVAPEVAVSPK